MGRLKVKGKAGAAKNYTTRSAAVKKLQCSLADFRRLCILKGKLLHHCTYKRDNLPSTHLDFRDISSRTSQPQKGKQRFFSSHILLLHQGHCLPRTWTHSQEIARTQGIRQEAFSCAWSWRMEQREEFGGKQARVSSWSYHQGAVSLFLIGQINDEFLSMP